MHVQKTFFYCLLLSFGLILGGCQSDTQFLSAEIKTQSSLQGQVRFPSHWKIQAEAKDITPFATVSLLYPPGHEKEESLFLSTASNAEGFFVFEIPANQTLASEAVFILEATRRLTATGVEALSMRTLVKWQDNAWKSISYPTTLINPQTTAIAEVCLLDNNVSLEDSFDTIEVIDEESSVIQKDLGSHTQATLAKLTEQITALIHANKDPVGAMAFHQGFFRAEPRVNHRLQWLLNQSGCVNCSFNAENLSEQNLSQKDVSGSQFEKALFISSNLSEGVFEQIQAFQAQFQYSNLNQTSFAQANLQEANFNNANLQAANLSDVQATSSTFQNADLRQAQLNGSTLSHSNFTGAQLSELDWSNSNIDQSRFHFGQMQNSQFNGMSIQNTDFSSAKLQNSQFQNTLLHDVQFLSSELTGSNFAGAQFTGNTTFNGALLSQVTWPNGKSCEDGSRSVCQYEFVVNTDTEGDQQYPRIAMAQDGSSVVVWNNASAPFIMAQRYSSHGLPIGAPIDISGNNADSGATADIAMTPEGRFVIVWTGSDNDREGIFAKVFDATGNALSTEIPVNANSSGRQLQPSVAIHQSNGDFMVSWSDYSGQDGSGYGVYQRRFNADGSAKTESDTLVNTHTSGNQSQSDTACFSLYCVVVFTDSDALDGSFDGVFARAFRFSDNKASAVQQVNTYTGSLQNRPSIGMKDNGTFTVAWQSRFQDGNNYGVYKRRFGIQNTVTISEVDSSESQVNTFTTNEQSYPSVAISPEGYAVISWQSSYQDGSYFSIYGQRYNQYGEKWGDEFQINTYKQSIQWYPAIALSASRRFGTVWTSNGPDGNFFGVAAKHMEF